MWWLARGLALVVGGLGIGVCAVRGHGLGGPERTSPPRSRPPPHRANAVSRRMRRPSPTADCRPRRRHCRPQCRTLCGRTAGHRDRGRRTRARRARSRRRSRLRLVRRGRLAVRQRGRHAPHDRDAAGAPQICEVTAATPTTARGRTGTAGPGHPAARPARPAAAGRPHRGASVAAVRRDFIANVSHELKTPVGAVSLLSEALVAARDDPEAVRALRQPHADRGAAADEPDQRRDRPVPAAGRRSAVARRASCPSTISSHGAIDFVRAAAEAKDIERRGRRGPGEKVFGDAGQLETALRNVLANAVVYSEPDTTRRGRRARAATPRRDRRQGPGHRDPRSRTATGSSNGSTGSTRRAPG